MSPEEIEAGVNSIDLALTKLGEKTAGQAIKRYDLLQQAFTLSAAATRGQFENDWQDEKLIQYRQHGFRADALRNSIHNTYALHFGRDLMQESADEWNATHPEGLNPYEAKEADHLLAITGVLLIWGIPFSLMGLLVRSEQRGVRVWWLQLVNPRFWLAGFVWPVGWFIYPDKEALVEFRRALNTAAGFLITAVSCCFGAAPVAKKYEPQKAKLRPWSIQLDLRTQPKFAGAPPYPEREYFWRTTVRSPSGLNFENVLQRDTGGWNDSFTFGRRVALNEAASIIPIVGIRNTSSGLHSPILGVQLYSSVPKVGLNLAVPAIQWEPGVKNTGLIGGFLTRTLATNWSAGAEGAVRFNREVKSWKIVPVLQRKFGRFIAELGLPIHDGDKVWVRGRLIWNVR